MRVAAVKKRDAESVLRQIEQNNSGRDIRMAATERLKIIMKK